jgi:hypothetical protein
MKKIIILSLFLFFVFLAKAQEEGEGKMLMNDLNFCGQWFLSYNYKEDVGEIANAFALKRGYFTFRKEMNEYLSLRFTQDITLDTEGDDGGNIEIRFKYCYLKLQNHYLPFLENTFFEFGMVHRPWIDFEQKINPYRVQGRMFMERYGVVSSADLGVLFTGLIGGKIDEEKLAGISSSHPGKYGSYSFGVFNGGGYHALEYNKNKIFEGRLSLRAFPNTIPGLQLSYNFGIGKGNIPESPDFKFQHACLSYENKYLVLSAQAFKGLGDCGGIYVNTAFDACPNEGYSFFGEFKIPKTKLAVFGRYDDFRTTQGAAFYRETIIGGISYRFMNQSKILVDTEFMEYENGSLSSCRSILEIALDLVF